MTTTETQHAHQESSAENRTSAEKKRQTEFRHNIAAVALLAVLIAAYSSKESDPLFSTPEPAAKSPNKNTDPQTNRAELIGLINNIFTNDTYWAAPHRSHRRRAEPPRAADDEFALGGITFKNFYRDYREALFSPHKADFKTTPTAAPEFTPAPSLSSTELGPELPKVAFNDRVRPVGRQPNEADFAAADRATDMYQRALFDKGWRGGEATAEQAKKAGKKMHFDYNPDRNPDLSSADQKAYATFSANQAKPTTKDEGTFTERPS